jgi:Uma2 family endonuclease
LATKSEGRLDYEDLRAFPDDNLRRELIDGELVVTAAPSGRHQDAVLVLGARLLVYTHAHGGKVYVAPRDVYFSEANVVQPDVVYLRHDSLEKVEDAFIRSSPDLVVEVSSPWTRGLDLTQKRQLYERFHVPEYWYVDLEAERVEIYRLEEGRYPPPFILPRSSTLSSELVPGFEVPVAEVLGVGS